MMSVRLLKTISIKKSRLAKQAKLWFIAVPEGQIHSAASMPSISPSQKSQSCSICILPWLLEEPKLALNFIMVLRMHVTGLQIKTLTLFSTMETILTNTFRFPCPPRKTITSLSPLSISQICLKSEQRKMST